MKNEFEQMEGKIKDMTIVSLSRGILGEPFIRHELEIGINRLEGYGIMEEINNQELPVAANINVGHATPRCIIPFGIPATVDVRNQVIRFEES